MVDGHLSVTLLFLSFFCALYVVMGNVVVKMETVMYWSLLICFFISLFYLVLQVAGITGCCDVIFFHLLFCDSRGQVPINWCGGILFSV